MNPSRGHPQVMELMEGSMAYRAGRDWTGVRADFFVRLMSTSVTGGGFWRTKASDYVWACRCESDMSRRLFLTPTF